MGRTWGLLTLSALLGGCGVAGTGTTAPAAAESAAQQAAQARAAQDEVRRQIDAAYSEAAEQRRAAEQDGR
jgi:hypothetical protein